MRYLLDTNICIYIIKQRPINVIKQLKAQSVDDVAVSSITLAELEYGAAKSSRPTQNREALLAFMAPLRICSFDDHAALHYGAIRAELERKGMLIGPMDMLIAAHARSLSLTLVTNNMREFRRVPDLKLADWTVEKHKA